MMQFTPVVKGLLIINIIMYAGTVVFASDNLYLFGQLSLYFFKNPAFQLWQPITHMFLHSPSSILHIVFNMYGLVLFGPALENWMGSNKFLFFYLASGLGAYLLTTGVNWFEYQQAIDILLENGYSLDEAREIFLRKLDVGLAKEQIIDFHTPMVGASGAVFGVLAGFALLYPNVELRLLFPPIPVKAKWLIGIYVAYETLSALKIFNFQSNVGHAAHVGGAIFGAVMVWYWKRHQYDQNRWD